MKILRKKAMPDSKLVVFYYKNETKLKMLVSFMVFLGMVKSLRKFSQKLNGFLTKVLYLKICIVALDILCTILWRVWIRIKVTPNKYGHIFLGEGNI